MLEQEYTFRSIGIIRTPYKQKHGVPIQGVFSSDSRGTLEVFPRYEEGLNDVEGFSHLILLYVFHRSQGYDLMVKPYIDEKKRGVFAVRAPKRPNPIGLSVVRLIKRYGPYVEFAEADMLDESPLLDIKPYVPPFDVRKDVLLGWMEERLKKEDFRKLSDDRF